MRARLRFMAASSIAALSLACGSNNAPAPSAPATATVTSSTVSGAVPRNAIVQLIPDGGAPMPEGPAVMDQYAKQFVPNTLYVRVGQKVEFRNSEDMPHNVTVTRRGPGTEVFNVSTEPQNKHEHTFDRVGQFDVTCDIHPGMQATVIASNSPWTTIADDAGQFTLANVKLGSYTIAVTFEGRTVEQKVAVDAATTTVRITP
jgi:plastocyanin